MKLNRLILSTIDRSILDSLNSGLILFDRDRTILLYNKRSPKTYFFKELPTYEGQDYRHVLPPALSQAIDLLFEQVLNGLSLRINELELPHPSGSPVFIGATLNPLTSEQGEVTGVIMNGNNITRYILESKEKQELKELNERLGYLLEQFKTQNHQLQLANIRNDSILETIAKATAAPLMNIMNSVNYLRHLNPNPDQLDHFVIMSREVDNLLQIKSQISRIRNNALDDNQIRPYNIQPLLRTLLSQRDSEIKHKNLQIEINLDQQQVMVQCIPEEISTAIGYILDNAIAYNRPGGKIMIADRIWENYYFVTIEDTGFGIHPDDLNSVFIPFFRGRNAAIHGHGMGLNLTLARNIIEKHNGIISIESEYEQRTSVTFYLEVSPTHHE
ncbi:MAG: PAS domain-containing sensor histidine kinase [Candidatus Delongbacteria bacterium]|nr:PAS domain-containing sensor histidine kinase [Candidatus Delongbacteria bacterium]